MVRQFKRSDVTYEDKHTNRDFLGAAKLIETRRGLCEKRRDCQTHINIGPPQNVVFSNFYCKRTARVCLVSCKRLQPSSTLTSKRAVGILIKTRQLLIIFEGWI